MTTIDKVLLTGKTHTMLSRSNSLAEDLVDIQLSSPGTEGYTYSGVQSHPTAEQFFAGAWSACYIAALVLVAKQKKVKLPGDLAVDIEVDLGLTGQAYLLQARLNVSMPGIAREVAETLAHEADKICPYSKATRGNIGVSITVVDA